MHSVIGAVIFVAFIVGCLLGASGKGKNQKEQTDNSDTQHNGAGENIASPIGDNISIPALAITSATALRIVTTAIQI